MTNTELAQKIRTLPGLTDAERSDLLSLLNEKKKYGLLWEEKPEQVEEDLRNKLPVLREVTSRRIVARKDEATPKKEEPTGQTALNFGPTGSANKTATSSDQTPQPPHHLLIEGDNLHALTVLNYTHAGKVDVIYIDPPYNTGNKDFKYNDRFVDREDSYRHSKWLSFMHKRLELARNLLKPEGVIFISIDDNEQAQLKLLCDKILGEENFVANVIWQKNFSPKSSAKFFSDSHEYALCYCKSIADFKLNLLPRTEDQTKSYKNPDNDTRGPWASGDLAARNYYSLGTYEIVTPAGRVINGPPKGSYWRYSKESLEKLIADNRIWFGADGKGVPRIKRYLSEVQNGITPQTVWLHTEAGNTQEAKKEILNIFGDNEGFFTTPKPLKLLNRIFELSTQKSSLILDFFAGSGTTLHAVMALNAEDGGNRQCILVTNNENNIAEEVCYERNRRVIKGYTNGKGVAVTGLTNNHLHYYQTAYVDRERTQTNKRALMQLATELLCIKENCFVETAQRASIRLFANDLATQHVVIVYDEDAIADAVTLIQDLPHQNPVKVYVFAPGPYPYTDDFEDVLDRIQLWALPEAIYQAFGRLLPPQGEPQAVETENDLPT